MASWLRATGGHASAAGDLACPAIRASAGLLVLLPPGWLISATGRPRNAAAIDEGQSLPLSDPERSPTLPALPPQAAKQANRHRRPPRGQVHATDDNPNPANRVEAPLPRSGILPHRSGGEVAVVSALWRAVHTRIAKRH
jgi:hypothetical protein